MEQIKVKRLSTGAFLPARTNPTDSGLDLYIADDVVLYPGKPTLIPHGFAIELAEGYEAQIRPRSSTLLKRGIHVALGTIDNPFRGQLQTCAVNLTNDIINLSRGDKISQLVVAPVVYPDVLEVMALSDTERGTAGWGSSGVAAPEVQA